MHGPMPPPVMLAKSVVFLPRLRGTLPWALWPSGGSWRCASRTRQRTPGTWARGALRLRASAPFRPRRALRRGGTFFERQPEPLEGAAYAGRRDLRAVLVVEELAVLLQSEVGVARDLPRKCRLQRSALSGRRTGRRFGIDGARLAPQPEVAPYGGLRDAEDARNLLAGHPAVDGGEHPEPEVLRVGFHARSLPCAQRIRNPLSARKETTWIIALTAR